MPLGAILERCKPLPAARYLVFLALDDKTITENEGRHGYFYGTIPLYLALQQQSILALEMNGRPLPVEHGAPARVRIETQLGFKDGQVGQVDRARPKLRRHRPGPGRLARGRAVLLKRGGYLSERKS